MGFNFNGVQASVTISGGVDLEGYPKPNSTQTTIVFCDTWGGRALVGNAVATLLRTNTAGKSFFMTSLSIGTTTGPIELGIYDNATLVWRNLVSANNTGINVVFPTPLEISADVRVRSSGNTTVHVAFTGYEE